MAYTKTTWVNESPASSPVKYAITDDTEGVVAASATIEVVTTVTPGTAVNATNLNHMEQGIEDAHTAAAAAQTDADAAQAAVDALQNAVFPAGAVAGGVPYFSAADAMAALAPVAGALIGFNAAGNALEGKKFGKFAYGAFSQAINANTLADITIDSKYDPYSWIDGSTPNNIYYGGNGSSQPGLYLVIVSMSYVGTTATPNSDYIDLMTEGSTPSPNYVRCNYTQHYPATDGSLVLVGTRLISSIGTSKFSLSCYNSFNNTGVSINGFVLIIQLY